MLQLGADSQGRISYEQFLQRRLALRPEIDALKGPTIRDTASENSQGITIIYTEKGQEIFCGFSERTVLE